jgi:AcrR family transcriptional regulator
VKRKNHEKEVRSRIIHVARGLFITRGFLETSMREIVSRAKVTTGSLYHFFENKEEILRCIVGEVFDRSAQKADRLAGKTEDPIFRFSLEIGLQMVVVADKRPIAEIYRFSYQSYAITKLITEKAARRNEELFRVYHPEWTERDFLFRSVAVKGVLEYSVRERLQNQDYRLLEALPEILAQCCSILGAPPERIQRGVRRAIKALNRGQSQ